MKLPLSEHRALVEQGRFDNALRLSGEALAAAEQALAALREAPPTDEAKKDAALALLGAGLLHVADLSYAGMDRDEAALAVSVPATLLVMKVNPETIPSAYVEWLQRTVGRLGDILPRYGHEVLQEPFWQIAQLAVATCDDYSRRLPLDPALLRTNDLIGQMIAAADRGPILFDGRPIKPQTAIDIFFAMLGTMGSLGWIQ